MANFPAYAAGLHLRDAWRRAGHDTSSSEKLVEAGRRLTDVSFVAFVVLFRDCMRFLVAPWAKIIQSTALEPWCVQAHWRARLVDQQQMIGVLRWAREFLRVCTLLRQWVPMQTVEHLMQTLLFARPSDFFLCDGAAVERDICFGKCVPSFCAALPGLMNPAGPVFQRVQLLSFPPPGLANKVCLGPHCQCGFARPRSAPWRVEQPVGPERARILVPVWVAGQQRGMLRTAPDAGGEVAGGPRGGGAGGGAEGAALPAPAPIRWRWTESGPPTRGLGNTFRSRIRLEQGGPVSRCVLPALLPSLFADVDGALAGASEFVADIMDSEAHQKQKSIVNMSK